MHELAIYSRTTFKAHLLGLLGQHILSKRKPGKSFQNTSLGNHSLVLARDGKRTEGERSQSFKIKASRKEGMEGKKRSVCISENEEYV